MAHLNMALPIKTRLENWRKFKTEKPQYFSACHANYKSSSPDYGTRDNGKRLIWFEGLKRLENTWRFTGYADQIVKMRHTGYYADQWQDETLRGIVAQLPARNRQAQYLAGYISSDTDTIMLEDDIYSDKDEAARAADSLAEYAAEESREYRIKDSAEQEAETLRGEIKELRTDNKALLRSLAKNRAEIRAKKTRIEALEENPYLVAE